MLRPKRNHTPTDTHTHTVTHNFIVFVLYCIFLYKLCDYELLCNMCTIAILLLNGRRTHHYYAVTHITMVIIGQSRKSRTHARRYLHRISAEIKYIVLFGANHQIFK